MYSFKLTLFFVLVSIKINLTAQAPDWAWAQTAVAHAVGTGITTDNSGNVYTLANYSVPTFIFGGITLSTYSSFQSNCAVTKQDANGNILWSVNLGLGNQRGVSVATDGSNNVFVLGDSPGGGGSSTDKTFLSKFDANGTAMWTMTTTGTYYCNGSFVAVDPSGNPIICGRFNGTQMSFNSQATIMSSDQSTNSSAIFIAKLTTNGVVSWAKTIPGNANNKGNSSTCLATDAAGNIYMSGWFSSPTLTFAPTILTNAGGNPNIFIAKLNPGGNAIWAKRSGGSAQDEAMSISVDNSGNSYLSGYFSSPSITFGSFTLTNTNTNWYSEDFFVTKFDQNGSALWAKNKDGSRIFSSGIDGDGNCYVSGNLRDSLIFAGTKIKNNNFLAKYDGAGHETWIKDIKSLKGNNSANGFAYLYSLSPKINTALYLTGSYDARKIILDTCTLVNSDTTGNYQAFFVSKIGSAYVGIDELNPENSFKLFPNPTQGKFIIKDETNSLVADEIKVINLTGQEIPVTITKNNYQIEIDLLYVKTGLYILEVKTNAFFIRKKVVVN